MLPELRLLFFSEAEARSAGIAHLRASAVVLPRGTAIRIGVEGRTAAPRFTITIRPDNGGEDVMVTLEREQLRDALIRACRERAVPIPHDAVKQVLGHRGGLMLMITRGKPPGGAWPAVSGTDHKLPEDGPDT